MRKLLFCLYIFLCFFYNSLDAVFFVSSNFSSPSFLSNTITSLKHVQPKNDFSSWNYEISEFFNSRIGAKELSEEHLQKLINSVSNNFNANEINELQKSFDFLKVFSGIFFSLYNLPALPASSSFASYLPNNFIPHSFLSFVDSSVENSNSPNSTLTNSVSSLDEPAYKSSSQAKLFGSNFIKGISGECSKDETFTIKHPSQLKNVPHKLECIFARGIAPLKPPIGIWYGEIISLANISALNFLFESFWKGKFGFKSQCASRDKKKTFYMSLNFVGNHIIFPAYLYIGKLKSSVAPGEYYDDNECLIVDYKIDFNEVCSILEKSSYNINLGVINSPFPLSEIIDLVRIVGRQDDGGYILLGKSYIKDYRYFSEVNSLIAWWIIVNYDNEAYPNRSDWTLQTLEKSFHFHNSFGLNAL